VEQVVCTVTGPVGESLALVALSDGAWGMTRDGELIPETYHRMGDADEEVAAAFVELVCIAASATRLNPGRRSAQQLKAGCEFHNQLSAAPCG
jgi:hypothetical protein